MKRSLLVMAAVLLAGCSGGTGAPTDSISAAATPGTPSPSTATPQQFASIIAGQESDWREVIKDAADCRYLWVLGTSTVSDKTEAMTCYVREATIVMTTGTAAKKIRALAPSSDVQPLVTQTLVALDAISLVDLEGVCGEPFGDAPKETKKCNAALGELFSNYGTLKKVLDEWKPYT